VPMRVIELSLMAKTPTCPDLYPTNTWFSTVSIEHDTIPAGDKATFARGVEEIVGRERSPNLASMMLTDSLVGPSVSNRTFEFFLSKQVATVEADATDLMS